MTHSGADPTYRTYRFEDSLLQMAQEREYSEMAAFLDEVLARNFPHSPAVDALLERAGTGDLDRVRELLDGDAGLIGASNETGDSALHAACGGGHASVVELLLDRGADPKALRSDGFRPIHSALFHNRQGALRGDVITDTLRAGRCAGILLDRGETHNIFLAAVFADMPAVKKWLEEDSDLANFEDTHHRRPISAAASRQDLEMVTLLLEHGADPSLPESDCPRGHALYIAARFDNLEMVKVLLEHGADPESSAESGGNALDQARHNPEMYELLLSHGAEPREAPGERLRLAVGENNLEATEAILVANPGLAKDPALFFGEGILALPAKRAQWELIELLRLHGATVPEATKWGCTYYLHHVEVARYLLEQGMNPNHKNWHGITLLHDMAHEGKVEHAELLLEFGADINAVDEEYRSTPLGLAARNGKAEMVQYLLDKGADAGAAGAAWATPVAWARKRGQETIAAVLLGS